MATKPVSPEVQSYFLALLTANGKSIAMQAETDLKGAQRAIGTLALLAASCPEKLAYQVAKEAKWVANKPTERVAEEV